MSLIKKPFEIEPPPFVKTLIYGQPGIGKTTLAMSGPRSVLLDFDGGAHRTNLKHRSDVVPIESWNTVIELLGSGDLAGYESIVCDSAGKMLDFMAAHIIAGNPKLGRGGALNLQGYGARKAMFRAFFHTLTTLGVRSIVFVAHDREEKRGDDVMIRPEVGGSSSADLIRELDLVGYMEASGRKRTISFDPCERFYGKNTMGLPPLIDLPDLDAPGARSDFLTGILERHRAAAAERMATSRQYAELMESIADLVEAVDTADAANEFKDRMATADHVWDSKVQAAYMLRDRAKALGLRLVEGRYEAAEAT